MNKPGATPAECVNNLLLQQRDRLGGVNDRQRLRGTFRQVQRDQPIVVAQRLMTTPDHLATAEQFIKHGGLIVGHSGAQDL